MQKAILISLLAIGVTQGGAPAPEVYLASFSLAAGKATIGAPVNISNNSGYDNQPSFTPDGRAVLFTSVRGNRTPDPKIAAATGSDIYRFEIGSQALGAVTDTAESEYSPTVMPDGRHMSVIQVEADGTQRLWKFPLAGGKPEVVLSGVKPVGYHAWADASTLALFVLGEPATLQVADVRTGKADVVARNIGRSIQRIPGGGISFVQREEREGKASVVVMRLDPSARTVAPLVRVMDGVRDPDLAWTPDGTLILAHAGKLYGWRAGQSQFEVLADLEALGLRGVSRMAISPAGDRIALVAQP